MARKKSTKDTFAAYITQLAEDYAPKNIELQLAFRIGAQAAMKWVMSNINDILAHKQGLN